MTAPIRRSPVHTGVVLDNAALTPRMRRVTVRAESMVGVRVRPAQDVELHLVDQAGSPSGGRAGRRVKRRYTIRHSRPETGELDLDVALHGAGPGAAWGESAVPGDEIRFQGPRGKLQLTSADWHVLVGDESALPAIAAICEALAEPAYAVIEVHDAAERQPVPRAQVSWVHRDGHAPGTPDLLLPAVTALELPERAGHAYLMGETRSMVALRGVLEGRGVDHAAVFVKGYWNIARPDRIAGRPPT